MMKKILTIFMLVGAFAPVEAQRVLSLDSCRALALRNNKQLNISKVNRDVATNMRKAARTKYLPKVDATGAYVLTSREVSLLSDKQKSALNNLGTNTSSQLGSSASSTITDLVQKGVISSDQASLFGDMLGQANNSLASALNTAGQELRKAFRSNTRNVFTAAIMVRQPIYMGGAITAANKIADINEQLADNNIDSRVQSTIYDIDHAYWLVVSMRHKQILADKYLTLVQKFDSDVKKMIKQGVATRSEGLKVDVKVNEAEMSKTQADDGVVLSKMLLCQLCGLPMDENITLTDEESENLDAQATLSDADPQTAFDNRPELKMLGNTVDMSKQTTKLIAAEYLPQVAAFGGYMVSNPNLYNSFERKFAGCFNVGVMVRVPVWSWFEGRYKINATKASTVIASLELSDAREKVELQVSQSNFRVREANKRLIMANSNTKHAEENLRCANLGFKEGVIQSTDVISAQTAWVQAQSQRIDAEIDVKLSQVNLMKALGTLQY